MDPAAYMLMSALIFIGVCAILHRAIWPEVAPRLSAWGLGALDRQRARHPFLDHFAGHRLDEPVAALRLLGFFGGREQLSDRELAREVQRSIQRQLDAQGLLKPLPDRPANWWAVARTADDAHMSTPLEVDLLAAAEDRERVWWEPLDQVLPRNAGYSRTLVRWAEISRGAFRPGNIREAWHDEWEPVLVSFEHDGREHQFTHLTGYNNQLDTEALRDFLNPLIAASGFQFEIVDLHHIPNIVVALRPEERRRLSAERGWRFAEAVALVI
jgi:hypothetical protein